MSTYFTKLMFTKLFLMGVYVPDFQAEQLLLLHSNLFWYYTEYHFCKLPQFYNQHHKDRWWLKDKSESTPSFDFQTTKTIKKAPKTNIIHQSSCTKVVRSSNLKLFCFEFRVCLAGRCLCSQKINKYSNKPAKGYERIIWK